MSGSSSAPSILEDGLLLAVGASEACSADAIETVLSELQFSKMAFLQRQLEYFDYSQWTWEIQEEECWGISFENPRLSGQAYFFYCGEVDYVVCYWDGPGHPRGIGESMEELRLLEVLRENSASRRSGSDFGRAGTANNGSDGSFVWSVQDPISAVAS